MSSDSETSILVSLVTRETVALRGVKLPVVVVDAIVDLRLIAVKIKLVEVTVVISTDA